jgi:peptidoglycan/LPS O-acetylase OafA/YrhL
VTIARRHNAKLSRTGRALLFVVGLAFVLGNAFFAVYSDIGFLSAAIGTCIGVALMSYAAKARRRPRA